MSFGCSGSEESESKDSSGGSLSSAGTSSSGGSAAEASGGESTDSGGSGTGGGGATTGGTTTGGGTTGGAVSDGAATGGQATGGEGDAGGAATGSQATGGIGVGGRNDGGDGGTSSGGQAGEGGIPAGGGSETGGIAAGGTGGEGGSSGTPCTDFGTPSVFAEIQTTELEELSGLIASRSQPGILYAHPDSANTTHVVAMNDEGKPLADLVFSGTFAWDCEDIATCPIDGTSYLFLGDIGDNAAREGTGTPRDDLTIYRFAEPTLSQEEDVGEMDVEWDSFNLVYPDEPHDAETLMADPVTGDILIVTKEADGRSQVFRAPGTIEDGGTETLEAVATLELEDSTYVTAGDISPNGDRVILRTYGSVLLFLRAATWAETFAASPIVLSSARESQGEAITFSSDGGAWFSASEGSTSIYRAIAECP
ncbi:MAG: hypothetical protein JW751_03475 [Polyangiaceae bacterium]|nr:hypothetical protein [Polyangiaceae bacterium]